VITDNTFLKKEMFNLLLIKMIMILLVWQPIGWITNKVHCKLQKKKNNTKISKIYNYSVNQLRYIA